MFFKISTVLNVVLLGAAILFYTSWQWNRTELELTRIDLYSCGGRLINVLRDKLSDDAIDTVDDLNDFDIPPGWFLPETGTAGDNPR